MKFTKNRVIRSMGNTLLYIYIIIYTWRFFILIFGICPRNVEESVCTGILEFNSRFCERMAEELSDSSPDEPQLPRPVVNGELSLFCRDMLLKHEIERFIVGKCCGYAAFFFLLFFLFFLVRRINFI